MALNPQTRNGMKFGRIVLQVRDGWSFASTSAQAWEDKCVTAWII